MGTWSTDILGGDGPLDTLAYLEHLIHLNGEAGLYPLKFDVETAVRLRDLLEENEAKIVAGHSKYPWTDEAWPVIAAVYLAAGAVVPDTIRDRAIKSCRDEIADLTSVNSDGWDNPVERIAVLEKHIIDIEQHKPGQMTKIGHVGLLETMSRGKEDIEEGYWWVHAPNFGLHVASFFKSASGIPLFMINDENDPTRIGVRDWQDVSNREGWVKVKRLNKPSLEEIEVARERVKIT